MANYLIKESTLKSIANDVRTMQGSTASMTASEMATQLGTVKNGVGNKIDTQTDLISQIKSALEGKAAGGGGSSSDEPQTFVGVLEVTNNVFNIGFEPDVMGAIYMGYLTTDFNYDHETLEYFMMERGIIGTQALLINLCEEAYAYGITSFFYNKNGQTILSYACWDGNRSTNAYLDLGVCATAFSNFSVTNTGVTLVSGENITNIKANGNYYVYAIKYS